MKLLKELSFEELTETAARDIHSSLLLEGGKGLKGSVHVWLQAAISWADSTQEKGTGKKLTQKKKMVYIVKRPGLARYIPKKDRDRNRTHVMEDDAMLKN
uniref:Uncharacterized protein n=1 Tax=viral metagenome TaxID=1070528 RepID=A0A6M3LT42_9ZZZZ